MVLESNLIRVSGYVPFLCWVCSVKLTASVVEKLEDCSIFLSSFVFQKLIWLKDFDTRLSVLHVLVCYLRTSQHVVIMFNFCLCSLVMAFVKVQGILLPFGHEN